MEGSSEQTMCKTCTAMLRPEPRLRCNTSELHPEYEKETRIVDDPLATLRGMQQAPWQVHPSQTTMQFANMLRLPAADRS